MADSPENSTIRIKKYPNRRFYNQTHSRHVTLDEMYHLVRDGHTIQVVDSDGQDITNIVLTQILLEHDPPKLDLFPAELLHQAIQANQNMVRRFIDQYFGQAMKAFMSSQRQFDDFLKQAGLSPMTAGTPFDWAQRFMQGFGQGAPGGAQSSPTAKASQPQSAESSPLDGLRHELNDLRAQLDRLMQVPTRPKPPAPKKPTTKQTGKAKKKRPLSRNKKAQ